jgi:hypothetical protein
LGLSTLYPPKQPVRQPKLLPCDGHVLISFRFAKTPVRDVFLIAFCSTPGPEILGLLQAQAAPLSLDLSKRGLTPEPLVGAVPKLVGLGMDAVDHEVRMNVCSVSVDRDHGLVLLQVHFLLEEIKV